MREEHKEARERMAKEAGALLAQLRRQAGLTQDEMAARLQISPSQVTRLERGVRKADLADLLLWSEVCGVGLGAALNMLDPGRPKGASGTEALLADALGELEEEDLVMLLGLVRRLQRGPRG